MRTAEALKKATGHLYPDAEVAILDTFRYTSPFLEKIVLGTYMEMLKMSPTIYGYLYRQAERGRPLSGRGKTEFNRILTILAAPKLEEYIKNFQPEVIVCTHPFPLGILSHMKKKGTFKGPVFATITDFTVHSFWVFPEVDCYIIGAEALMPQCKEFGIESECMCPTGIPIDPAFNTQYGKYELRKQLGLEPALPVILVMGGGLGMGPLETAVKMLGESQCCCQLIVVAGTNKVLEEKLRGMAPTLNNTVKVFGFVRNIHQLMAASDLMVGKAGGLTCAEAMAARLPLLIIDPLPGQEERNTEFMTAMGTGVRIGENDDLAAVVQDCLEVKRLEKMSIAAAALGKPDAAYKAVKAMAKAVSLTKPIYGKHFCSTSEDPS